MDEGPPMFSALDDAFERAELPTLGCSNPTLGNEKWDVYIHHILNSAGVTIEKLQAPAEADETTVPLHESVQIILPLDMEATMQNKVKRCCSAVEFGKSRVFDCRATVAWPTPSYVVLSQWLSCQSMSPSSSVLFVVCGALPQAATSKRP